MKAIAFLIFCLVSLPATHASTLWSIIDGFKDLGTLGSATNGGTTTTNVTPSWDGSQPFDTTRDGCVLFLGAVGSSGNITLGSLSIPLPNSDSPWRFFSSNMGGWNAGGSSNAVVLTNALSGNPSSLSDPYGSNTTFSGPGSGWGTSWIVARNSHLLYVIKATGSADPQIYKALQYRTKVQSGSLQGIWGWNDGDVTKYTGDFGTNPLNADITGWYNGWGASSRNHFSLIPISAFPTNAFTDFILPHGHLRLSKSGATNALVQWDKGNYAGTQTTNDDAFDLTFGRNLVLYWNSSVGNKSDLANLNLSPEQQASVAGKILLGINTNSLNDALSSAAVGMKTNKVTTGVTTTLTGTSSYSVNTANTTSRGATISMWATNGQDLGNGVHANDTGTGDVDETITTTTKLTSWYTVKKYHNVATNVTAYTAGSFLEIDADTGQVIGTISSANWAADSVTGTSLGASASGFTPFAPNTTGGIVRAALAGITASTTSTSASDSTSTSLAGSKVTGSSSVTTVVGWHHPVTISLSGKADFLSGEWRQVDHPLVWNALRLFDLDGHGQKLWEWVGPTEGILVWNPAHDSTPPKNADNFFQLAFHGKLYPSGYAALASIAPDGSTNISGEILSNIWVWVDKNSNGVADAGEYQPITSYGVTSLSLSSHHDSQGGLVNEEGATLSNGKSYPTRDWWSQGGISPSQAKELLSRDVTLPCLYNWSADSGKDNPFAINPPFSDISLNTNLEAGLTG